MARQLKPEHRELLNPYGEIFGQMSDKIFDMPDAELKALSEAVNAANTGNCWCMIFDAATWLRTQIHYEFLRRKDRDAAVSGAGGETNG